MHFYTQLTSSNKTKVSFLILFVTLLSIVLWPHNQVQAAPSDIEVTIFAAPNLVVDSNVLSPSTQAPEVATIAARFCNTSGSTINDLVGYIGDYNSGTPANSTPGIYPSKTDVTIGGQLYSGTYSFTHLGGTVDGARLMGPIGAGECRFQYWSFSYPKNSQWRHYPYLGQFCSTYGRPFPRF